MWETPSAFTNFEKVLEELSAYAESESPVKVFANVDLNISNIDVEGAETDTGYNMAVGVDGVYAFTQEMGIGLGLDFNMLKAEFSNVSGAEIEVNYLDIPVSFAYTIMPATNMGVTFLAGPYVGIPLGDWEGTGGTKTTANVALGANVEAHTTWTLAQDFALGAHVGFKYAFNDLMDEPTGGTAVDVNYWALGLGVSAKFL